MLKQNKRKLVVDIETDSLDATVIHVAVTKDIDTKEVRSFRDGKDFTSYIHSVPSVFIMHNGISFDAPVLNRLWNARIKVNDCIDTLLLSRLFSPIREKGHALDAWGIYLGCPKIHFNDFEKYSEEMLKYCKQDVEVTEKTFYRLLEEGKDFSEESMVLEHEVQHIISKQIKVGFNFDLQKAQLLLADLMQRANDIQKEITEKWLPVVALDKEVKIRHTKDGRLSKVGLSGIPDPMSTVCGNFSRIKYVSFNLSSRQQISDRLKRLGWKPKEFTEKGQAIVNEKVLERVNIPEAKQIAEYLTLEKRNAQIKSWIEASEKDGRVHGSVITNGAITGRMTHRKPNMAQVPSTRKPYGEECRECWIPSSGNSLIGIDASSLELRMLSHYMNDKEYTKEVVHGDIHTVNQMVAGLQSRDQAKTFIYAFIYGAGDAKIGAVVGGSRADGKELKERFLNRTPALANLRERVFRSAKTGKIKGVDGRYLRIRSEHSALNVLLQGAGAIVMKKALTIFYQDLLKQRLNPAKYFVANIHDEWQLDVPTRLCEQVANIGIRSIRNTAQALNLNCPLDGEYKIGNNWSLTH